MHNDLHADEEDLGGQFGRDSVTERIYWLIRERLERLGDASGGWDVLYRDPRDGRLWELTYPHSAMHGGGPPRLHLLSMVDARAKYQFGSA